MYHSYPRRRKSGVIVPFLLLVALVLTAVLAFQVWNYFHEQNQRKTENKAAVEVVAGQAEIKLYGEQNWFAAPTGSILREGDALKTFPDARVSMTLSNGSFVRLDSNTEISLDSLRTFDGQDSMSLSLSYGDVWLKAAKADTVNAAFIVSTSDASVRTTGTVFAVSKRDDFRVAVIEGKVDVDMKEKVDDKERVFETLPVGVGQQMVISAKDLQALRERKNPDLLFALSDELKSSSWYTWNMARDSAPQSASVSVEQAVAQEKNLPPAPKPAAKTAVEPDVFPSPEVTEPAPQTRSFSENRVVIRGTTSPKTQKMKVKTFVGGKEDTYALQKYVAGSTSWLYIVSTDLANFVPGQNRYQLIAIDANGKESPPTELLLYYEKEKPVSELKAPTVESFNDAASNVTSEDAVKVAGKIGKGMVKIFVNDFALTKYVPDTTEWVYFAKVEYQNLKDGLNEYTIYGLDTDGRKTPVTKFTITKKAKANL